MTEYTMDTFHAEMAKRGVRITRTKRAPRKKPAPSSPSPRHGTRAFYYKAKCRCALCRAANSAYYHTLKAKREKLWLPSPPLLPPPMHGRTIERVVACGVHPLHDVKVRANGARSGCPMCEMQIESLCHAFTVQR